MNDQVRKYLAEMGRKGGKSGRGASKARSSEQARKAVQARWEKARGSDGKKTPQDNSSGE